MLIQQTRQEGANLDPNISDHPLLTREIELLQLADTVIACILEAERSFQRPNLD